MKNSFTIKINFTGGIISPGELMNILSAAASAGIRSISFGLRQQLFLKGLNEVYDKLATELKERNISFETGAEQYPNIVSSYPAEEIFITKTWLSEGVYKDIFDAFDYTPKLKINISDSKQSFTPFFTGNINWVASDSQHFWHLFIRFPKTNNIYEWPDIAYTNDIAIMTKDIETGIVEKSALFYDTAEANGPLLYERVMLNKQYNVKPAETKITLPPFMLPYYEGFNRVNNQYWLGIYRRDEHFSISFLQDVCALCQTTKIGQLCSTPWKSLIVKGIEEKDRALWDTMLGKHQVNVRHAANELNFQVEDDCREGLALKSYLIKHLQKEDIRTFGICIGIKTRRKSEVFSSILVKRKPMFTLGSVGFFYRYDILCAKDFNPNERTGFTFSHNNFKWKLPKLLRQAIVDFYAHTITRQEATVSGLLKRKESAHKEETVEWIHQCPKCFSVYDVVFGEPENSIVPGTAFVDLPENYCCPLCEESKKVFVPVLKSSLLFVG